MIGVYIDHLSRYCQGNGNPQELIKSLGNFIDINESDEDIFKKLHTINPDYIVFGYNSKLIKMKSFKEFEIPKIIGCGDFWARTGDSLLRDIIPHHGITGIGSRNKCDLDAYEKYLGFPVDKFWFKWGIDPEIVKDYGEEKKFDFTIVGRLSRYAFRKELEINMVIQNKIRFNRFKTEIVSNSQMGSYEKYCRTINQSLMTLGGCIQKDAFYNGMFVGNMFQKTLEVPGCNSLLVNCHWGDESDLGFKDNVNCVLFDDLLECMNKINYYTENPEEAMKISKNGYDLVQKTYTSKQVVKEFIDDIERIYGKRNN